MANQVEKTVAVNSQYDRAVHFLKDVRNEVTKVTWPSANEVKGATAVVLVVCLIVAMFLWTIDKIINFGMNTIF